MKQQIFIPIALCLTFTSCNEDPKLVKKRREQNVEIVKLRGELALVEGRLKRFPPDKSTELEVAKQETEKLEEKHKLLSGEVSELEAELKKIHQEYNDYKRKYAIQ